MFITGLYKILILAFVLEKCLILAEEAHTRVKKAASTSCSYGTVPYRFYCDECGLTNYGQNARIVGGSVAASNSWPAQVLIAQIVRGYYPTSNGNLYVNNWYRCGGTLLNRYTVVTSAQCIMKTFSYSSNGTTYTSNTITSSSYYSTLESSISVYVGAQSISFISSGMSPTYPTVVMSVRKIVIHENYNTNNLINDIALLILSTPVSFDSYVQPACMPHPGYGSYPPENINMTGYVSGWGVLSEGSSSLPTSLNNVRIYTYNRSFCSGVSVGTARDWNTQICAGQYTGGKDTCDGDIGGGLYVYDSSMNKYVVVGIASTGEGCARAGKPGIYTRISAYYDWITNNWESAASAAPRTHEKALFLNIFAFALFFLLFKSL